MVPVAGTPLLAHGLGFAARLAPRRIIVVGGFGFPLVEGEIARRRAAGGLPPVVLIENKDFRDGNLVSLLCARRELDADFLLMNVDHIFRPAIAAVVASPVQQITAHIDTDRTLGADDMKVLRDGQGRVSQISKTLTAFDCGYVGMTRVPSGSLARYFAEADAALAEEGRATHVERLLARLAATEKPPHCRDISGHGWLEVDTGEERAAAEAAMRGPGWT